MTSCEGREQQRLSTLRPKMRPDSKLERRRAPCFSAFRAAAPWATPTPFADPRQVGDRIQPLRAATGPSGAGLAGHAAMVAMVAFGIIRLQDHDEGCWPNAVFRPQIGQA